MKSKFKRLAAVLLAVVTIFTSVAAAFTASASEMDRSKIPIIYLEGQGHDLYINYNTPEQEQVYPIKLEDDYITSKVQEYLPVFAKAVVTQEWDDFCDAIYESVAPVFEDIKLDENGESANGSTIEWTWSPETLTDTKCDGTYGLKDYIYYYDWRLDPIEVAEGLHDYIEAVLEVTGNEKVSITGRCLGANIVCTYLSVYDGQYIDTGVLYCGAMCGAASCSKPFCGELTLEGDSIERYVYDKNLSDDLYINEFLRAFITAFNKTYGLDLTATAITNVYPDIYLNIVPRILRESYGTFPAYWSMVSVEDYQKAKDTVFYGVDEADYAGLISKIDNYHNTVKVPLADTLLELDEKGIDVAIIAKYGYQLVPVVEGYDIISDGLVTTTESSFGATTSDVEKTFTEEYLKNAELNGTAKYISPDNQIDASTCLLPDSTWIIKNSWHASFPDSIDKLIMRIFVTDDMSVDDYEEFPQYLVYDDETGEISAMTEKNENTTERWNTSLFSGIIKFFTTIFSFCKNYIESLFTN